MIGIDRQLGSLRSPRRGSSPSATSALVPPNCSTRTSPCRSATAATASWIGAMPLLGRLRRSRRCRRSPAPTGRPARDQRRTVERAERRSWPRGCPRRVATRSVERGGRTAASATSASRCTRTISEAGSSQPLRSRISWACARCAERCVGDRVSSAWGTNAPTARTASATKASQPKTAVFRCRALHRPDPAGEVPGSLHDRDPCRTGEKRTLRIWRGGGPRPIPPAGGAGVGPARPFVGRRPPPRRSAFRPGAHPGIGERPHPPRVPPQRAIRVLPVGAGPGGPPPDGGCESVFRPMCPAPPRIDASAHVEAPAAACPPARVSLGRVGARDRRRYRMGRGAGRLGSHHRLLRLQVPDREPARSSTRARSACAARPASPGTSRGSRAHRASRGRRGRRRGPAGPAGPAGEDGDAGPAGVAGPVGPAGPAGRAGRSRPGGTGGAGRADGRDRPPGTCRGRRRLLRRPGRRDLPGRRAAAGRPGDHVRGRRVRSPSPASRRRCSRSRSRWPAQDSGTVTSTPAGIDCGTDCTESYACGTSVQLHATPATGSLFGGWSGACTGTGACTVAVHDVRTVHSHVPPVHDAAGRGPGHGQHRPSAPTAPAASPDRDGSSAPGRARGRRRARRPCRSASPVTFTARAGPDGRLRPVVGGVRHDRAGVHLRARSPARAPADRDVPRTMSGLAP